MPAKVPRRIAPHGWINIFAVVPTTTPPAKTAFCTWAYIQRERRLFPINLLQIYVTHGSFNSTIWLFFHMLRSQMFRSLISVRQFQMRDEVKSSTFVSRNMNGMTAFLLFL